MDRGTPPSFSSPSFPLGTDPSSSSSSGDEDSSISPSPPSSGGAAGAVPEDFLYHPSLLPLNFEDDASLDDVELAASASSQAVSPVEEFREAVHPPLEETYFPFIAVTPPNFRSPCRQSSSFSDSDGRKVVDPGFSASPTFRGASTLLSNSNEALGPSKRLHPDTAATAYFLGQIPVVMGRRVMMGEQEDMEPPTSRGVRSSAVVSGVIIRSRSSEDLIDRISKKSAYPSSASHFETRRRAFSFSELDRQLREEQKAMNWGSVLQQNTNQILSEIITPVFERNTTMAMMSKAKEKGGDRPRWKSKTEYLLTSIGYAVGLGNLWRFPYLCYENGGGVFLIPYFTCLIFLGIPMFMMEVAIGQKMQMGFLKVWRSVSARLTGIGISSVLLAMLCSLYYNIIIAWSVYYLFNSFRYPLPWTQGGINPSDSAQKFWVENCLHKASSMGGPMPIGSVVGGINWGLFASITFSWVLVYLCVFKGISSSGKVVYFTAIFPYVGLVILFFRGITLPGALTGISYYLLPNWSKLLYVRTWATAGSQIFYSLGIAWGSLVNFASFNPTKNDFLVDTFVVTMVNCLTSVFAGFVVFSVVGFMAHTTGMPVDEVARAGSGLAFVVYPAGIGSMPGSTFFSILFFIMLVCLGIDSEFAMVEVVITSIIEASWFKGVAKERVAAGICCLMWIVGWLFISPSGSYWVDLMDTFTGTIALYVVALCEVTAVVWIYGLERFIRDIIYMTGKNLGRGAKILFKWIVPIGLVLLIMSAIQMFVLPGRSGIDHFYQSGASPYRTEDCPQGDQEICGGILKGECDTTYKMCICKRGWAGDDCLRPLEDPTLFACPENCNAEAGRGRCVQNMSKEDDSKPPLSASCECAVQFLGISCKGDKYLRGWPGWAIFVGWLFALGTLVPIPLIAVVRTIRRRIKKGIDERPLPGPYRLDLLELPPTLEECTEDFHKFENMEASNVAALKENTAHVSNSTSSSSDDDLRIYGTSWELSSLLRCRRPRRRFGATRRRQRRVAKERKKRQLRQQLYHGENHSPNSMTGSQNHEAYNVDDHGITAATDDRPTREIELSSKVLGRPSFETCFEDDGEKRSKRQTFSVLGKDTSDTCIGGTSQVPNRVDRKSSQEHNDKEEPTTFSSTTVDLLEMHTPRNALIDVTPSSPPRNTSAGGEDEQG